MEWINPFSSLTIGKCECGTLAQHELVENEIPPPRINPYDILHLRRDATPSEIKKAFRRLGLLHHPGRITGVDEEQQLRKLQLFDLLAAAYETLVDKEARRRYDIRLNSMENMKYNRGLAGEMFVGGKRLGKNMHELLLAASEPEREVVVPELVRSDSASTFSSMASSGSLEGLLRSPEEDSKDGGDCLMESEFQNSVEQLLPENQVSKEEKERILGGPLRDLFEARRFAPFSDSLVVFEEVFGSKVFDTPRRSPTMQLDSWDDIKSLLSSCPAGWEGSSKISADGRTRVFTTSRILHNKRVTRIETFTDDPVTGTRTKSTTVTSEPIPKDVVEEEVQTCLTICGGGVVAKKSDEEPLLERNEEGPSSSSCFCKDLLYSYYEICSQLYNDCIYAHNIRRGYYNMIY